jgi:multidrug resistance efflux pump
MWRKAILPALALAMLFFAVYHVSRAQQIKPRPAPPAAPPRTPFPDGVAGSGIVEPESENIAIGSAFPGIVAEVNVRVGDRVKKNQVLFRLDDRQLRAELKYREANLASAEAQLEKLEALPRPEERPPSKAKVEEARANNLDQQDQFRRAQVLYAQRVINEEELVRRRQAAQMAEQQLRTREAEDQLLDAGAWEPDKKVARAAVALARAQLQQTRTDLERLEVCSPIEDGEVLQRNVRPGEFVGAPPGQALIVLGCLSRLHIRADIDEHDIPRFRTAASAVAVLRGDAGQAFDLEFVRVEPYVVPKKSLTGDNTERVDTRVLQVIYRVKDSQVPVYVGQQVDVFIDGPGSVQATAP